MTECVYNMSAAAVGACSSVRTDSHHTWTVDMKLSSGCLQAGSYITGGLLMSWAVLFTLLYGLGLAATLALREVATPGMYNLPQFYICSPALATYSETGRTDDGCISSSAIWRQLDLALSNEDPLRKWAEGDQGGEDVLNRLVISLSVGLLAGLLLIGFISVLLHGLTAQRAGLVEVFCVYYAMVIGLGAIATIVLSFTISADTVSFYWIPLLLHLLGLAVINSHRKELLVKESFSIRQSVTSCV